MEKQSTRLIYPGKHSGTLLLTYEARIKQLERKHIWAKQSLQ